MEPDGRTDPGYGSDDRSNYQDAAGQRIGELIRLEHRSIRDARFHFWVLVVLMLAVLAIVLATLMLHA